MTSANGTYQQPGRGQLAQAAVDYVSQAHDATGGERVADGAVSTQTYAEEAEQMLQAITELTKRSREEFLGSREFPLPVYRAMIYKRLHDAGCSTPRIGKLLGKNHATILHGIKTLKAYLDTPDKDVLDMCFRFEQKMKQPKTNTTMSKLFFTEVSFAGGLRKVEADIWPTMTETFHHSIVAEEHLETLKANLEQLVEKRAAELKVKAVPVALSPEWSKLKDATLPRFLSVGRINVMLTEVRRVIGKDNEEAAV